MSAFRDPATYQGEGHNWQHISEAARRALSRMAGPSLPENTDTDELDRDAMRDIEGGEREEGRA